MKTDANPRAESQALARVLMRAPFGESVCTAGVLLPLPLPLDEEEPVGVEEADAIVVGGMEACAPTPVRATGRSGYTTQ